MKSNLELIEGADRLPYSKTAAGNLTEAAELAHHGLWSLLWEDEQGQYPIGYMLDRVVQQLQQVPANIRGDMDLNRADRSVLLFRLPTERERSRVVAALAQHWRDSSTFKILGGWRNELWPVYGRKGELLFSMERAAMGLLGTMRYGVHLTAYVVDAATPHGVRLWVPKRALDKATFPGMLDNSVAGGLMTGEDPLECVIREADEEASLPDYVVRPRARCVGNVTYAYMTHDKQDGEGGYIYPECQWVYDLELSAEVIPQPKDGEVERFYLCDVEQVKDLLAQGRFKHNSALVVVDFFIRHGILTGDNEADLAEIKRRMHRELHFPGPHQSNWHPA